MAKNLIVYKHMYTAPRMGGYKIDFNTKHSDRFFVSQVSPASAKEPQEERVKIIDTAERLHQIIGSIVRKMTNLHN